MKSVIFSIIAVILLSGGGIYWEHYETKKRKEAQITLELQEKENAKTKFTAVVGPRHSEAFKIRNLTYTHHEFNRVIMAFDDASKEFCSGSRSFNPALKKYNWIVSSLMSGCLNFFLMNDLYAWKSMDYIGKLLKDETKDCYTVGFSQLYLMNTYIKCNRLSAIDIDWKIISAHRSLVFNLYGQQYNEDAISDLYTHPDKNNGLKTFCHSTDTESCRSALKDFSARSKDLREINLQLSFLDEIRFMDSDSKNIVIYVSNAIDQEYTTPEEFRTLVRSIFMAIGKEKTAYVVYHTGGGPHAAIYKLKEENGFKSISAQCRDDLVWAPSYGALRGRKYSTYFDTSKFIKEVTNYDGEYDYSKNMSSIPRCTM